MSDPGELDSVPGAPRDRSRIYAAAALAAVLVLFSIYMVGQAADASDLTWSRLTYVYAGVEAIGFSAVGWLFGSEVHRQRADEASEQARSAQASADESARQASDSQARGLALAEAVRVTEPSRRPPNRSYQAVDASDDDELLAGDHEVPPDGDPLSRVADRLFPYD